MPGSKMKYMLRENTEKYKNFPVQINKELGKMMRQLHTK